MAKTIANFLVGVGLDSKQFDAGMHDVNTGLSRVRSMAGIAGTALAGAFSASALAAINAGNRLDQFALRTEKLKTAPDFVYAYGNALRRFGGNADEAIDGIDRLETALRELQLKGSMGPFQDVAFAGVDIGNLAKSKDGEEFLKRLSVIIPQLSTQQQGIIQNSLGLSDSVMKSLKQGEEGFARSIEEARKLGGEIGNAVSAAREYNDALAKIGIQFDGIANSLAEGILPQLTGLLNGVSDFITNNKDKVSAAVDYAVDNAGSIAAGAASLGVAGAGAGIKAAGGLTGSKFLSGAGGVVSRLGVAGAAVSAGSFLWDLKASDIERMTGKDVSKYYRAPSETWEDVKGWWGNRGKSGGQLHDVGSPGVAEIGAASALGYNDSDARKRAEIEAIKKNSIYQPGLGWVRKDVYSDIGVTSSPVSGGGVSQMQSQRQQPIQNNIGLKVEIGGRALESKITEVIERRELDTYNDMNSTVVR